MIFFVNDSFMSIDVKYSLVLYHNDILQITLIYLFIYYTLNSISS